jgi:membrane protein YqaA with SNARE-associated domain
MRPRACPPPARRPSDGLFYLLTFLAVIPSPFLFFIINCEAWAIFVGLMGTRDWVLLALSITGGQVVGFTLLYFFGSKLVRRVPRLQRAVDRFDKEKLKARAPWALSMGALVGVPPHNVMCAISPLVGLPFRTVFAITLVGRGVRYLVLAGIPAWFAQYFDTSWIPEWLRELA